MSTHDNLKKTKHELATANREFVAAAVGLTEGAIADAGWEHDDEMLGELATKHEPVLRWALDNGLPAYDLIGVIRERQDGGKEGQYTGKLEDWAAEFADKSIVGDLKRLARDHTVEPLRLVDEYEQMAVVQGWYQRMADAPGVADPREIREIATVLHTVSGQSPEYLQGRARGLEKALRGFLEKHPHDLRRHLYPSPMEITQMHKSALVQQVDIAEAVQDHMQSKLAAHERYMTRMQEIKAAQKPRRRAKALAPAF